MSDLIQPVYPWNRSKVVMKKRNQGLGNIISLNFIFLYYLLFVFVLSGKIYPVLRNADVNLLGHVSNLVLFLRFLVFNWWISVILFFITLIVTFVFTALITKTRLSLFKTYLEYLKIDTKNQSKKEVTKIIFVDILKIAGLSIIGFIILELLTFAISTLITTMILPIVYDITEVSLSYFFLAILLAHIVFFPLLIFFYNRMVMKKMVATDGVDFQRFLKEDGEVDMEKWKEESWGKKPYTFDWEEEDVFPITCFSCGSIISSDLTICPICDVDLIKEIEAIETETLDDLEIDNSEESVQKDEKSDENSQ
ncbi:MAG: hypothetical protein ACTSQF_01315 [Candidatus Heimdallarchaeaceae archaeon]